MELKGREERESRKDQQCVHCGLYYTDRGIKSHEEHCPLQEFDGRLQPLEDYGSEQPP
jgi:hypothetical protein